MEDIDPDLNQMYFTDTDENPWGTNIEVDLTPYDDPIFNSQYEISFNKQNNEISSDSSVFVGFRRKKKPKTKIKLTKEGKNFKKDFYALIKNKRFSRKVKKEFIKKYSEKARSLFPDYISKVTREESRIIDKYFNVHAPERHYILKGVEILQNLEIIDYERDCPSSKTKQ